MAATSPPTPRAEPLAQQNDPDQRRRLIVAKLKGLIRGHLDSELTIDESLGRAGGFVASEPGREGQRRGVFYAEDERMVGPAVAWALRSNVDPLYIVAEAEHAGALARRTAGMVGLRVEVLEVDGTELKPATPTELAPLPVLDRSVWELAPIFSEAGARAVDDHGRVVAEVAGLEVARIVSPTGSGEAPIEAATTEAARIEVGVGEADRELHTLVHSSMNSDTAVRRAVAMVAVERRRGSLHPLSRMARERWLRSMLLDDPGTIGLSTLHAVPPLRPRSTVLGHVPIAALGTRQDGSDVVVVCSTGIDLDVVPEAMDYRRRDAPDADLVIVVPERDRHAATVALAAVSPRTEVVGVVPPW